MLSASEVLERANQDLTYRQLDYWVRAGWVTATRPGSGSGNVRRFTEAEANIARLMGRLVSLGVEPWQGARVARACARGYEDGQVAYCTLAPGIVIMVNPGRERESAGGAVPGQGPLGDVGEGEGGQAGQHHAGPEVTLDEGHDAGDQEQDEGG